MANGLFVDRDQIQFYLAPKKSFVMPKEFSLGAHTNYDNRTTKAGKIGTTETRAYVHNSVEFRIKNCSSKAPKSLNQMIKRAILNL